MNVTAHFTTGLTSAPWSRPPDSTSWTTSTVRRACRSRNSPCWLVCGASAEPWRHGAAHLLIAPLQQLSPRPALCWRPRQHQPTTALRVWAAGCLASVRDLAAMRLSISAP